VTGIHAIAATVVRRDRLGTPRVSRGPHGSTLRKRWLPLAISPTSSTTKEHTMNWDVVEGNWKQFKGHVKEKWGKLTDDNLDAIAGKREQLAGRLQEAYGITKDQAELQVKAFEEIHKDYRPTTSA
jgi:uncharacterized protein YjbJ (UPF0337 family)